VLNVPSFFTAHAWPPPNARVGMPGDASVHESGNTSEVLPL
jgi:hypothetical protein